VAIRKWMVVASLALVAVVALTVASIGSAKPAATDKFRVALVTDIGGLNDKGFNASAYAGLKRAQASLGVDGRVFISKSAADYIPNLSTGATQGYDLVIAVGFLMSDSTAAVAKRFPKTKFAIVDVSAPFMKGKPKNVRGIVFAEQEAGCLAGVAAATVSKTNVISSVGGIKIPPVDAFIAGYQFCSKKVKPGITTLNGYSQDFVAQDKCKEVALQQMGEESDVVFQVAGGCGLGVLDAAKEQGKWGIGVDVDQRLTAPQNVLTSAEKKVDVGVYDTIAAAVKGTFKGGTDRLFTLKDGGVGLAPISSKVPASIRAAEKKTEAAILSGKLKPPVK